jgi:glycosyltransferase involved in cell wall biosynthesis
MLESGQALARRRVLFVLPDLETPPTKGYQVRCISMAEGLGEHYVSRIVAAGSNHGGESIGADRRPIQRLLSFLSCLRNGSPLQSALFDGRDVARGVREIVDSWKPTAVIVVTERLPTTIGHLCSAALIVDVVDSMRIHMQERADRSGPLGRLLWGREARAFARSSVRIRQCARYVIAGSTSAVAEYPTAKVIANAARSDPSPRGPATIDLIFTGNLSYWPNIRAAIELCEKIAPAIRRAFPRSVIVVAGRSPSVAVRRACAAADVTLMANVADMASLLRASRLAVAPVEWTPGANLKVLEALAAGTPVLTYPATAQQLPADVDGVRVCDGPELMSHAAIEFLRGREVHEVARRDQHTWNARAAELEALLDAIT